MPVTVHAPAPSRALVRLREAIAHCRHAGIAVSIGAPAPVASTKARLDWELGGTLAVDPVGAALIAFQPPAIGTFDQAVGLALGCETATVIGIRDGLGGRRPIVGAWPYTDGYATGLQLRAELLAPMGALRVVS